MQTHRRPIDPEFSDFDESSKAIEQRRLAQIVVKKNKKRILFRKWNNASRTDVFWHHLPSPDRATRFASSALPSMCRQCDAGFAFNAENSRVFMICADCFRAGFVNGKLLFSQFIRSAIRLRRSDGRLSILCSINPLLLPGWPSVPPQARFSKLFQSRCWIHQRSRYRLAERPS